MGTVSATTEDKPVVLDRILAPEWALIVVYTGEAIAAPPGVHVPGRGVTAIGRDAAGGIALPGDRRASRVHATVHRSPAGTLRLVDERSRNGTWVNGQRVADVVLSDGDVIGVGDSYLIARALPRGLGDGDVPALIGGSPVMRAARAAIAQAGPTTATVLLLADSGCGKEVAARALHALGRPDGPFVAVNCSAIPEGLAESQFFGQVAGAFTGATARPGWFRAAHGGTLFLDEIGDLPAPIQPKLLRVLEERAVIPVGATAPIPVDVRVVAATHRDLVADLARVHLRGDLYARLAQLVIRLRPLRERREDVLALLAHALGAPPAITPRLAEALLRYAWPFNVRELRAVAQELQLRGAGAAGPLDLPLVAERLAPAAATVVEVEAAAPGVGGAAAAAADADADADGERDDDAPAPDRAGLEALLAAHRGVVSEVARAVGRSRKQVYRWIASHRLDVARFRGPRDG